MCKRPEEMSKQIESIVDFSGLLSLQFQRSDDLVSTGEIKGDSIYAIGTSPPQVIDIDIK